MHRGCSSSSEWRKNRCIVYDCGRAMPKSAQLCRIGGTSAKLRDCCTGSRHGRSFPAGWDAGSSFRRMKSSKRRSTGLNMRAGSLTFFVISGTWFLIHEDGDAREMNFFLFDCKLQFSISWNISMIIWEIAFLIFFFVLEEWWFYLSII